MCVSGPLRCLWLGSARLGTARFCARPCARRDATVVSICRTVIIDCRIPRDGATVRALNTPEGPDRTRCIRTLIPRHSPLFPSSPALRRSPVVLRPLAPARTYGYACARVWRRTGTHTRSSGYCFFVALENSLPCPPRYRRARRLTNGRAAFSDRLADGRHLEY